MAYIPVWELLSKSLTRLISNGSDSQQIKIDLSNAIADQKIRARAKLPDEDEDLPGRMFTGAQLAVPQRLKPSDFDWERSVPIKGWYAGDSQNVNIGWERRSFESLELRTEDVVRIFETSSIANETSRTTNGSREYSKWVAVQDGPWTPPSSLEKALRQIQDLPVVWFNQAVDIMAFGDDNAASYPMEFSARRCQASRELCQAAKGGAISAIGNPDKPGDRSNSIPRGYFDIPRQMGSVDNSIETAIDKVTDQVAIVAISGGHTKWFNVRIATRSLVDYLRSFVASEHLEFRVEPYMIEPMTRAETAGYVPLSSALLWIMTDGASRDGYLQHTDAWEAAVARLLPLMATGEVEVLGRTANGPPETVNGSVFAGILVSDLLHDSVATLSGDDPWISPTPYVDNKQWRNGFNDQLFLYKAKPATWTHLQVKKSDVLRAIAMRSPATSRKSDGDAIGTARSHKTTREIEEAYRLRVEQFEGKKPPSRADDEKYFKSEFGLTRDRARELRDKCAPAEWSTRGRRKSVLT